MQIYNQFIDICNNLMKYITTQNLVYGALISIAFFLVWAAFSVITSSIRKFYVRCGRLEKFIKRKNIGYENLGLIDGYCRKISRSFAHGWNKFKRSSGKRPSDYLTKKDVLDAEVSDGMLNHGKTLMKTFIGITTVLLFILNLAQLGKDMAFTFNILVESMFMPFVYYVAMMLIYFIANLIKQQTYIIATAHFYSLVDNLDECFDIIEDSRNFEHNHENSVQDNSQSEKEIPVEEEIINSQNEEDKSLQDENSIQIEATEDSSDESETSDETVDEIIEDDRNFDELKNEVTERVDISDDLDDTIKEPEAEQYESSEWGNDNLENYDVFKKKNIDVDKYVNEIPDGNEHGSLFIDVDRENIPTDEIEEQTEENLETDNSLENSEEENIEAVSDEVGDLNQDEEITENLEVKENADVEEAIEEDLEANDNIEIEDVESQEELSDESNEDIQDENYVSEKQQDEDFEIDQDEDINSDEFDFFGSLNETENIDEFMVKENSEEDKQNNFKAQLEQNLNDSTQEIDSKLETDSQIENLSSIVDEFKQNFHDDEPAEELDENQNNSNETENDISTSETQKIYAKINDLEQLIQTAIEKDEEKKEQGAAKTKKSKKGNKKMTENNSTEKKTRGRPKIQAIDENLVITTEEQFEDILARAEKLMRKTEQGLSASQSKRIEKELKIMMDAMNKYKEG